MSQDESLGELLDAFCTRHRLDRASCTLTSGPTIFAAESTPRDLGFEDGLQLDIQYESELMQLP